MNDYQKHLAALKAEIKQELIDREGGAYARHRFLAYGLLRGRRYKQLEAKCTKAGDPSPSFIANFIPEHIPGHDKVKAWLEGDYRAVRPTPVEAAA